MSVLGLTNPFNRVPALTFRERPPQPAKAATPGPAAGAGDLRHRLMEPQNRAENQTLASVRSALRLAIDTTTEAASIAEEAAAAAGRGLAAVEQAEQAMAPFATLDERVAAHHAGVARAGGAPGRGLPADLVEGRRARAAAAESLNDAQAAHAMLAGEAEAASAAAEGARVATQVAARTVTDRIALDLVDRLRKHEAEAARLRFCLSGYGAGRILSDPEPPHAVGAVFHAPYHAGLIAQHMGYQNADTKPWGQLRRALASDADAELEPSV